MLRVVAKSKLQRLRVTDKNLLYEGSIAIDSELLRRADIVPGEMVQVVNITNGERFETYCIAGGPGEVSLNGGAARLGEVGDSLIVISTCLVTDEELECYALRKVEVDERNRPR